MSKSGEYAMEQDDSSQAFDMEEQAYLAAIDTLRGFIAAEAVTLDNVMSELKGARR